MEKMSSLMLRGRWAALVAAAALVLSGCPSPNTYGTARTTPKNKLSHTISAEVLGVSSPELSGAVPTVPSYQLRYGTTDRTELGGRIVSLSSLGLDFKVNFLRSDVIDLAVDPGIQTTWVPGYDDVGDTSDRLFLVYLHGPLLVDLNVTEALSFVFSPGVLYAIGGSTINGDVDDTLDISVGTSGMIARLGIGMNFRFSDRFAIQPEVTFLKPVRYDEVEYLYTAGIGFNFGALPNFGPEEAGPVR